MSRDLSGVYTLPAGSTVANGDPIVADDLNIPLADLEADANTARPIVAGGTGASSASAARTNLGLGTMALQGKGGFDIEGGTIDGVTIGTSTIASLTVDLAIADGGTGASSASAARTNLGLVIGTDVQAFGADLTAIEALASTGIAVRTAANTWAQRTITSSDSSITITNPGGVAGDINLAIASPGSMTLLGTLATTSGGTVTLGSLTLTSYKQLLIVVNGVSQGGGSQGLLLGSGGPLFTSLQAAAEIFYGHCWVDLATGVFSANVGNLASGGTSATTTSPKVGKVGWSTATTSLTFDISGGSTFDAGELKIYGVK